MADPLRAALRVVRERLTDDGFRALAHAMLDAALDELRDQPRAPSRRTARGETMIAPVSALRRAAQRAGVPWPYTARGRPDLRRRA